MTDDQIQQVQVEVDRLNASMVDVTGKLAREREAARVRNARQLMHISRLEIRLKNAGLPVPPFPTEQDVLEEGVGEPAQ